MEEAFPPKRTSNNIYRDRRYEDNAGGETAVGETRDSLDRLAGSTSGRRRLSRVASASSTGSATPPPLPLPSKASTRDTGHSDGYSDGYGHDKSQHPEWKPHSHSRGFHQNGGGGELRRAPISAGDALSHEVERRPHVRGATSEAPPGGGGGEPATRRHDNDDDYYGHREKQRGRGGRGGEEEEPRRGGGGGGGGGEIAPETADGEAFLSSLRGGGGGGSAEKRAGAGAGGGGGGGAGVSGQPGGGKRGGRSGTAIPSLLLPRLGALNRRFVRLTRGPLYRWARSCISRGEGAPPMMPQQPPTRHTLPVADPVEAVVVVVAVVVGVAVVVVVVGVGPATVAIIPRGSTSTPERFRGGVRRSYRLLSAEAVVVVVAAVVVVVVVLVVLVLMVVVVVGAWVWRAR
ncbi:unnamed protein product [Laminaria digitata]